MAIQLSDLTNGSTVRASGTQPVWEGTAIFDVLMKAVNENINIQYELTRITGSDYATVYLGAIETCIKEATNLLLQKAIADKEIEVKQAQINVALEEKRLKAAQADAYPDQAAKDLLVKQANIELLNRQKEGFDDNKYQKLFEAQMNAWALMFSSGLLTDKPTIISNDSASALYNTLKP